jgi:myo-inositol-1(or 4)-monophosphatase
MIDASSVENISETAQRAVSAAGKYLRVEFLRSESVDREKGDGSIVTTQDLDAESIIRRLVQRQHPDHEFISEEDRRPSGAPSRDKVTWLVDPLDGTDNFRTGLPFFASTVAVTMGGRVIASAINMPLAQRTFWADIAGRSGGLPKHAPTEVVTSLKPARISLIPTYRNRSTVLVSHLRDRIHGLSRRLVDTWCPSMDWVLLALSRIDGIVACYDGEPDFDSVAGRFFWERTATESADITTWKLESGMVVVSAARGRELSHELTALVQDLIKTAGDRHVPG